MDPDIISLLKTTNALESLDRLSSRETAYLLACIGRPVPERNAQDGRVPWNELVDDLDSPLTRELLLAAINLRPHDIALLKAAHHLGIAPPVLNLMKLASSEANEIANALGKLKEDSGSGPPKSPPSGGRGGGDPGQSPGGSAKFFKELFIVFPPQKVYCQYEVSVDMGIREFVESVHSCIDMTREDAFTIATYPLRRLDPIRRSSPPEYKTETNLPLRQLPLPSTIGRSRTS